MIEHPAQRGWAAQPRIRRHEPPGEVCTIETTQAARRARELIERPARAILLARLVQPQPQRIVWPPRDAQAAWRAYSARQILQQLRLVGQRLALPVQRMIDFVRSWVGAR